MKGTFLVPSLPTVEQLTAVWQILSPLREAGHQTGVMLVLYGKDRFSNLSGQYETVANTLEGYGDAPMVTMPYCFPLEEMDFLHHEKESQETIRQTVQYTANLPVGGQRVATFHLGTMVEEEENDRGYSLSDGASFWREAIFPKVQKQLRLMGSFDPKVKLLVETVPVPEFGDFAPGNDRMYRGNLLRNMLNPFYLTGHWGFSQIREAGLGICLDTSHSRVIYDLARACGPYTNALFTEDVSYLADRTLMDDVCDLREGDLIHLCNGRGLSSPTTSFEEGLPLDDGDISRKEMGEIITTLIQKDLPIVLEMQEKDFIGRPNTKQSIRFISEFLG